MVIFRKNPVFNRRDFYCLKVETEGILGSRKSGNKRPVYVNGVYCESMIAGAKEAARILGKEVTPWQMHRVVNEGLKIGVDISEKRPVKRKPPVVRARSTGGPLLRYPRGETPCERGLPRAWR